MVYRLEKKQALRCVKRISNANIFESVISRDEAHTRLIDDLLALFDGHAKPVMARLVQSGKLTLDDIREAEASRQEDYEERQETMIESLSSELIAHLWQSTLVVGVVWLMTLALRGNRARVRYWLWTAASVKFLVPFSWLVSLGAQFEWRSAPAIAQPVVTFVMEEILAPPVIAAVTSTPTAQPTAVWPWVLASVWVVGFVVVLFWWWREWIPLESSAAPGEAHRVRRRRMTSQTSR